MALLFGAFVYVAAIIAVLAEFGVWTMPLLGVIVGWAVASAGVMFFTVGEFLQGRRDRPELRELVVESPLMDEVAQGCRCRPAKWSSEGCERG